MRKQHRVINGKAIDRAYWLNAIWQSLIVSRGSISFHTCLEQLHASRILDLASACSFNYTVLIIGEADDRERIASISVLTDFVKQTIHREWLR